MPADYKPPLLPDVDVPSAIIRGRNLHDGYARGWGLQFSDLGELIDRDPLYRAAYALVEGRPSHVSEVKRKNLFLILTRYLGALASQDVVEFGSYQGGSAMFMAAVLKRLHPDAKVYALDTFEGMPETDANVDAHRKGHFADVRLEELRATAGAAGLTNLVFVKGMFQETFPGIVQSSTRFGLAHIDCDILESVRYSQSAVWDHMVEGGYVVYDDAEVSSCLGATQAVEELIMERRIHSEQIWPHFVFRAGL